MTIQQRLEDLNIDLSSAVAAVANYVPTHLGRDSTLYISGQLPFENDKLFARGILGASISIENAYEAARLSAVNVLAQVYNALDGDMERIVSCVKLTVFVAATSNFEEHPKVANGASDLIVDVLGDMGYHSRSAVGVASLPFNAPIEVEAIFDVKIT